MFVLDLKEFLRKIEVNRAVFYSVMSTGWSALAGLLTILTIAHWLSMEEQGFFYTFSSVISFQYFIELGLTTVIIQIASHEWAFLNHHKLSDIQGDSRALSRLASLLQLSLKWYCVCGMVVIVLLSVGGYFFFMSKPQMDIEWQIPWFTLCIITGVNLMFSPFLALIEGCNMVASVYSFRFIQGLLNSLVLIISIFLGFGLYSLALSALTRFGCVSVFLLTRHYRFISQLMKSKISEKIIWRKEVWPFQWRIGISWLSGNFIFSIFTPIMFYFHGPKVAGQMGMTWTITWMIVSLSIAWINTRMPQMGIFIANKQYQDLDRLFNRLFQITVGVATVCSLIIVFFIYGLHIYDVDIKNRLLPILPMILLIFDRIIAVISSDMVLYLRAHKKEPVMLASLFGSLLTGISTWLLGASYGPVGALAGLLIIDMLWGLPITSIIFLKCRKKWHA